MWVCTRRGSDEILRAKISKNKKALTLSVASLSPASHARVGRVGKVKKEGQDGSRTSRGTNKKGISCVCLVDTGEIGDGFDLVEQTDQKRAWLNYPIRQENPEYAASSRRIR